MLVDEILLAKYANSMMPSRKKKLFVALNATSISWWLTY